MVKLEDIDAAGQARKFTNDDVYFPTKVAAEDEDDGELTWAFFVRCRMEDAQQGLLGTIIEVDESTINTLFVVERLDGEELLVPAQEEFLLGIDQENRVVTVELPQGLLDLENVESAD